MSTVAKAEANGLALLAGIAAGYITYRSKSADAKPACAGLPPAAAQSFQQAWAGWKANKGEDAVLSILGFSDLLTRIETLGLINSDSAAEFYAWYHNLTPDQAAAVKVTEDGGLWCAVSETGQQALDGSQVLLSAALTGVVVYLGAQLVLED